MALRRLLTVALAVLRAGALAGTGTNGTARDSLRGSSYASVGMGPPKGAMDYCGMAWPDMTVSSGTEPTHFFSIGDWGGMDGTLWTGTFPPEGRERLIAYKGGASPGAHVFPRTRWNKAHSQLLCSHDQFVACYNGEACSPGCGFVPGVDTQPQQLVAAQFGRYAAMRRPKFILNVGDNFYWGGIEVDCGHPMGSLHPTTRHQFSSIYEGYYGGGGLNVPWISALGNHDWGGRVFNNGWDQQIAYTWVSPRWVLPAPYYSQHVEYPDQGFSLDILVIDSNVVDAKPPASDPQHNICSEKFNPPGATCALAGGPKDVKSCPGWFASFWQQNQRWAEKRLASSRADWQIMVTHFPCGHYAGWYRQLYAMGLDLLVTGHRHNQELWDKTHPRFLELGGLTCVVTGGGGGISSENTPVKDDGNWLGEAQYGFYDFAISKSKITIESINYRGAVVKNATVLPK